MADKKVYAVCFGGASTEHEVSCVSAAWVVDNIDESKYRVVKIGITKGGIWFLYTGPSDSMRDGSWENDKANLYPCVVSPCKAQHGIFVFDKEKGTYTSERIDAVFPVLHGKNGEDGTIQGLFTLAGIPFVGADTYSSAVCMNKHTAKLLVASADASELADWICVKKQSADTEKAVDWAHKKGYPLFVKPACAGSSIGVSKVKSDDELFKALDSAFVHDNTVLVEEAISGREIETAVLETKDGVVVSRCGEIDPGADFYDYNAKYIDKGSQHFIPARIPDEAAEKVRRAAKDIFLLLDCSGLARADFFVCSDGRVVFNEINTLPGMTAISLYPLLMADYGLDGKTLTDKLFESAVKNSDE